METLRLTSDREQPRVPRRFVLRVLAVVLPAAAVTVLGAWVAAGSGGAGRLLGAGLALLVVMGLVVLVAGTAARRTGRLVVGQRDRSLRLPGPPTLWRVVLALLALSLVLPVVAVLWLLLDDVAGVSSSVAVGTLSLLVLGAPVVVQVLRGRIRAPYLEMDADGLTHHGMSVSTTVLWTDVTGLRLVADPGRRLVVESSGTPQRTVRSATPGERPVGGPHVDAGEVSLPVAFLGSDAAVVADLIQELAGGSSKQAQVAAAELRAGLATGATLERLRTGRLRTGS